MGVIQIDSLNIDEGELVYVCGPTGGGKTTLLRRIQRELGTAAGFVLQNPDNQIVNDRVYAELAFGPANQGKSREQTGRRVAETAAYFGISKWINRDTASLSGGEKQLLAIASVMAADPEVLLLDEPAAMLDPVMADRLLDLIFGVNREFGITVVIAEHRPDRLFAEADRIIWVNGEEFYSAKPCDMAEYLRADGGRRDFLPASARLFEDESPLPLTVREAKKLAGAREREAWSAAGADRGRGAVCGGSPVLEMKNVSFAYVKNLPPVLSGVDLTVNAGEIVSLSGENGSGKTTLAYLAAGSLRPYSGSVKILGSRVRRPGQDSAMLFQDVTCHFTSDECGGRFAGRHPYDLSGGEQQLMALESVLEKKPALLILDEPTKGLDAAGKRRLAERLDGIRSEGGAVLLVTHDIEFAAETADRMALLFAGEIVCQGTPEEFCGGNIFFTTAGMRIFGRDR